LRRVVIATALACLLVEGCASHLGFGRARTLARGQSQVSGSLELQATNPRMGPQGEVSVLPWAELGAGLRYGVTSRFEVGGRAWVGGLQQHYGAGIGIDGKTQIYRGTGEFRSFDVALVSAIAYHSVVFGGTPSHTFHATIPLLFGINEGPHQLFFGPRVGATVWTAAGQDLIRFPWGGGSLGLSARISPKVYVVPEMVVVYAPVSFNGTVHDARVGAYEVQVGVGLAADL